MRNLTLLTSLSADPVPRLNVCHTKRPSGRNKDTGSRDLPDYKEEVRFLESPGTRNTAGAGLRVDVLSVYKRGDTEEPCSKRDVGSD
jgi:hypothetical protein